MVNQVIMYVYILRSETIPSKTYIGIINNLQKRLVEHNANTQLYTSRYSPWSIETYIAFSSKEKAYNFERYLKTGSGRAFLKKRLMDSNKQACLTKH